MVTSAEYAMASALIIIFFQWTISIITEKILNIKRIVYCTPTFESENDKLEIINFRKLSRSVDSNRTHRIKTRGTPQFARGISIFIILIYIIYGLSKKNFRTITQHFIEFDQDSIDSIPYLIGIGAVLGDHLYDLIHRDEYSNTDYLLMMHHILTIVAAAAMIIGRYTPNGTWYGIWAVIIPVPIKFCEAFRYEYASKYPKLTRKMFKISTVYYICTIICNLLGQVYLLVYGGFIVRKLAIYDIILYPIAIIFWIATDYQYLKAMQKWSTQKYEQVDWSKTVCYPIMTTI